MRSPLRTLLSVGSVVAVGVVAACSSSSDDGPAAPASTGMCESGLSLGDAAQDACVTASCCGEFAECNGDEACAACLNGAGENCDGNGLLAGFWECFAANQCDRQGQAGSGGSGGEGGGGEGGAGEGGAGTGGAPPCVGAAFRGSAESWKLPTPAAGISWMTGSDRYALVDIHGDGKPDLVITGKESDPSVGEKKWLVYRNDGSSFSSSPETWTLPTPAGSTAWMQGYDRHTLIDIHGDGKPDLVITGKESDSSIGETKWLVYKNDGSSFSSSPETWTLPTPAGSTAWMQGYDRHTLVDIHGDGKPDLVITGKESDSSIGETKWLVYRNGGSSFDGKAESWSLPSPAGSTAWMQGYERHTLVDIHGDGKPDLVITGKESDPSIGETKWLVYKNGGSSFDGKAESWSLPSPAGSTAWMQGYERHTLVDIHGDGKPDLVITGKESDSSLGETKWLVYKNGGSSFDANAETWKLPSPAASTAWVQGYERYALIDIHGDAKPDLVITGKESDSSLGETKWLVYPNDCAP